MRLQGFTKLKQYACLEQTKHKLPATVSWKQSVGQEMQTVFPHRQSPSNASASWSVEPGRACWQSLMYLTAAVSSFHWLLTWARQSPVVFSFALCAQTLHKQQPTGCQLENYVLKTDIDIMRVPCSGKYIDTQKHTHRHACIFLTHFTTIILRHIHITTALQGQQQQ